jgi:hypothetical protein
MINTLNLNLAVGYERYYLIRLFYQPICLGSILILSCHHIISPPVNKEFPYKYLYKYKYYISCRILTCPKVRGDMSLDRPVTVAVSS